MLILPPGHSREIGLRRRLSVREKRLIGAVLATLAALVVALVISLTTAVRSSGHGCIYLTIPAATGAQEIYECGDAARSTCASAATPGAFSPQSARTIQAECRKASLPIGR